MSTGNDDQPNEELEAPPARWGSLWLLTFGPGLWAVHFLLSYVTVAVWCAKVGRAGALGDARLLVGLYTLLALLGIALTAWRGYRQHRLGNGNPDASAPHDYDTPADRHRFLGYSTLLLCGLSFFATLYVALTVVFIGNCR